MAFRLIRRQPAFSATIVLTLSLGIGSYAVTTHSITRRRREIGVRVALGAAPAAIDRLAGSHVARLAGVGVLLGLVGALAVGKLLASMLFGIVALDAITITVTAAGLGAVAMMAGLLPLRRALAIDPVTTLRED